MAKADASRNYYQDLGIAANADENEIRKAFRQLALKYHPDRNPGRETEFVVKFQQIQAAHEVLSDPAQRIKYDNERRKFRALNIPPYNPGTPRNRPPPPPRNAYTTTTPSGSYYRAPPPKAPPPAQRPPPPQHHTTYSNGADRFTSKNFRPPPPPPPTAQRPDARAREAEAKANVFTAWQKMKQPRNEDPRTNNNTYSPNNPFSTNKPESPYNSNNPYNPNNPNGTPFGRSKSTKVPSSKKGFDPGMPGGDEGQARSAYRSNYERPAPAVPETADPLKHFKEQMDGGEHVPYAEGNRIRTPYSSTAAGERTSIHDEGIGRSASMRNSPTQSHRPSSTTESEDSGRKQRASYGGTPTKPSFAHMYPSSSDDSEPEVFRPAAPKTRKAPPKAPPKQEQKWANETFGGTPTSGKSNDRPEVTPNFKSRSEESINMKFSPSDWHGKFEGKPDYFAPSMQKGASNTNKGRTSPSRGRPAQQRTATDRSGQSQPPPPVSPFSQPQSSQMPPPPPPPPPLNTQADFPSGTHSVPHSAKFSGEAWTDTFKEPSWAFPLKTKDAVSRPPSSSTKRPKAGVRKPSVVANGASNSSTQSDSDNSRTRYQAFAEDAGNVDGDAMDIDSGTPPVENPAPMGTGTRPVPPPPQANGTGKMPNGHTKTPSTGTKRVFSPGLGGIAGLANVEPFLPSTTDGPFGVHDLKDTLPFKSQASDSHPTKPSAPQELLYPKVPTAPAVPISLDEKCTREYLENMEAYAMDFKAYNKKMTSHFAARHVEMDDLDEKFTCKRGEPTKKLGFSSYLRKMKEDEKVLETWKLAHEMHLKALEQCEQVRNKTVKVYAFEGL
jgi:curved DNA-binding protein CbpA